MSAKSEVAGRFKVAVCAGQSCSKGPDGCGGPIDAAHWIPAQRIRRHLMDRSEEEILKAVYDPRSSRPLCRKHHTEEPFTVYYRDELPQDLWDYAAEWDLEWSLTRDYPSFEELQEAGL